MSVINVVWIGASWFAIASALALGLAKFTTVSPDSSPFEVDPARESRLQDEAGGYHEIMQIIQPHAPTKLSNADSRLE